MCIRLAVLSLLAAGFAYPQCEPSKTVKEALNAESAAGREKRAARGEVLDKALAANPTDYFLLQRERDFQDQNTSDSRESSLAYFTALRTRYPDSPAVTAVYAEILRDKDPALALSALDASEKAHPGYPWTIFGKLRLYSYGPLYNKPKLGEEIDAFLRVCPSASNAMVYVMMSREGSAEQSARYAPGLRKQLEGEAGAPSAVSTNQALWRALWDLEFKAAPPNEHAAVRERIGKELARLDAQPHPNRLSWLNFLVTGYTNIGDKAAVAKVQNAIVDEFPKSQDAERIVAERWRVEHPFPTGGDKAAEQAWYRLNAAANAEWYERWHGLIAFSQQFHSTAALDDVNPEALLKLAQDYVAAYHEHPNAFYGAMPTEFDVSEALIRKGLLNASIPDWLDQGYQRETNRPSRGLGRPREGMTDEEKKRADLQLDSMRLKKAEILLSFYSGLGQNAKSRAIDDQLAGLHPWDERLMPQLYEVRAKAAEMDNRKLDALVLYQSARALGGKQGLKGATDAADLDVKIAGLFKDLGGSTGNLTLFTGRGKVEPVSVMRWEKPNHPLPAFALTDLGGKSWKLADLNGKATLINVWATWCGPCLAELPEFQKLYDQLKDRKDIALLTLNVDSNPGVVAPFLAEKKYTFPVLFGTELLAAVSGDSGISIPQNWLVGPSAKLAWTEFGYGGEPQWPQLIRERLEALIQPK
jgi:thiol-disulfide isomerase/thioredoxin